MEEPAGTRIALSTLEFRAACKASEAPLARRPLERPVRPRYTERLKIAAVHSALVRGELFASPAPLYQYGIGVGSDSPHSHMPSDFAESTILAQAGQRTHRALMRQGIQTPVVPPEASSGPKNFCIAD